MKRFATTLCTIAIVLLALVFLLPTQAQAATVDSGTCGEKLTWTLSDKGVLTISGTGAMTEWDYWDNPSPWNKTAVKSVVIKDGVTTIGDFAFYNYDKLTKITIPNSVTTIGDYAFCDCDSLTKITIPGSVTTIGDYAFSCDSLTKITLPDSVTTIGDYAFSYCNNLQYKEYGNAKYLGNSSNPYVVLIEAASKDISSVKIHKNTKVIYRDAFSSCSKLKKVTIPDKVTVIGYAAFDRCTSLISVTIGKKVETIGGYAFNDCNSLTEIKVAEKNANFTSDKYGVLFNKKKTKLIQAPGALSGEYTIPSSVKTIGEAAFKNCDSLTGVTIGKNVKTIGDLAFYNCTKLTSVTVGSSVTTIGNDAFAYCYALTSLSIPNSIKSIGTNAFAGCKNLTYKMYSNAKYLGNSANPYAVLIVASQDISSCTIHKDTRYIYRNAFSNCSSLKKITIPSSVTAIDDHAFSYCYSLTSVTLGKKVKTIGSCAFYNCVRLTSIKLPDSVKAIGSSAFYGCSKVTQITIGSGVSDIGRWAFGGCTSVKKFSVSTSSKYYSSNSKGVLFNKKKTRLVQAPAALSGSYTIPDSVVIIGEAAFKNCDSLTGVTIGKKVKTIGSEAFALCSKLTKVTIPDSVITIGSEAFSECSKLSKVTIGKKVTTIGWSAFYGCEKLTGVTMGKKVKTIGDQTFYNCTSLTSMVIPDSVTTIGERAFRNCTSLTKVTIGSGLSDIGWEAFDGCTGLKKFSVSEDNQYYCSDSKGVLFNKKKTQLMQAPAALSKSYTIPESVTTITPAAFAGCDITGVSIPKSVTEIAYRSFTGCAKLTSVSIPANVTSIGWNAFGGCEDLTSVAIPKSVTEIYSGAFEGCTKIKNVYYNGTASTWKKINIDEWGNESLTGAKRSYVKFVSITKQPASVVVANGKTAKVTVKATGDGLTYKWYYKNKGETNFSLSSTKTSTYKAAMKAAVSGRQVYCKITDKYGNTVTTKTVTLSMKATITSQPKNVTVANGKTATVTVKAAGEGLTYKWYYKNKGATKFSLSSVKTNTYKTTMKSAVSGRKVYCKVTDKFGNTVNTKTVTLKMK